MSDDIKRMCVRQAGCWCCRLGRAAHTKALDCKQYTEQFPQIAKWIAKKWLENNGGDSGCP